MDVRNVGEEVTGGEGWAVVRTAPGKPGKVHIVSAVREGDKVNVTWTAPATPNGQIRFYVVYVASEAMAQPAEYTTASDTG